MDGISADLTAFILAGGKSTRMGADKAFVMLHGHTLLAKALALGRCGSLGIVRSSLHSRRWWKMCFRAAGRWEEFMRGCERRRRS